MLKQQKTENPTGAGKKPGLRMVFDSRLTLEFHGSKITSDAGSGSAARVVPDDFGTDWTTEIGNREVRMKKKLQDSHEYNGNHGRGVFASGRKWACEPEKTSKHPRCQRKTVGELEKRTCNPV